MKPDDFDAATFSANECDGAWHVYGALLTYSLNCPEVLDNDVFVEALDFHRAMFGKMFERMER